MGGAYPGWARFGIVCLMKPSQPETISSDVIYFSLNPINIRLPMPYIFLLMCEIIDERMGGVEHQDSEPEPG